jgi:MFS family permease
VRSAARGGDAALTLAAAGVMLSAVLPQYLVASLAVEMRSDFAFSEAQLGMATAASFGLSALLAPSSGRAIDRFGPRRGVLAAVVLVGLSSLAMGTVASSAAAMIALMAVNGLGTGIGAPTLFSLLAANVSARRQGAAFGVMSSAPQMAVFCAGLALPLAAGAVDWRIPFLAAASIGALCVLPLVAPELRRAQRRADRQPVRPRAWRPRSIHVIALSAAAASAAGIGMRSFLVLFTVSIGFTSVAAGLVLSLAGLLAIVSRLGFGVLGDRRPGDGLARASGLMVVGALGYALMALEAGAPVVVGAALAGGLSWGWQTPLSLAVVSANPHATSAALGMQMSGFFAGALVGPPVIGLLAEQGSFRQAWLLCVVLALGGAAMTFVARRMARDEMRENPSSPTGSTG